MRRRRRVRAALATLLHTPVLRAVWPSMAAWDWIYPDPVRWNIYTSFNGGATWTLFEDYWVNGNVRQFAPDGGSHLIYVVGVDAEGVEITERSNAVVPDDAVAPRPPTGPGCSLFANGTELPDCRLFVDGNSFSPVVGDNVITNQGSVTLMPGKFGNAFTFDGASWLVIDDALGLEAGAVGVTVEGWVWLDDLALQTAIWAKGYGTEWYLAQMGDNKAGVAANWDSTWFWWAIYNPTCPVLPTGEWVHVAMYLAGDNGAGGAVIKTYVNGELANTLLSGDDGMPSSGTAVLGTSTDPITLGAVGPDGFNGYDYLLTGQLEEFAIYGGELAAGQIAAIYDAGILGLGKTLV